MCRLGRTIAGHHTQLAMENLGRKTTQWFPNESRTNEGKRLVYSNSAKDMVKVLDFVQLGGPTWQKPGPRPAGR